MRWRELGEFRDASVPKLDHLRRARRAGLRIPATRWCWARDVLAEATRSTSASADAIGASPFAGPCVVRSASPAEDGAESSAAGRFHSERVDPGDADQGAASFAQAVRRVVASLTVDADGAPVGAVFVQPFVAAARAGIAFYDGHYYEQAWAPETNVELTSGASRGTVVRADHERGEPWSEWLAAVARAFPELDRLDLEWAEDDDGFVLLQVRRASFAVRRNPLVSVANHREILGEAPSPWIVSVLEQAGAQAFDYFASCDPAIRGWGESYARLAHGRAWMDFSAFFRLMDHWGLPRTFVTEGVGGQANGPEDARFLWRRFARSAPRLVRLQLQNVATVFGMTRLLERVQQATDRSRGLGDLHAAMTLGLASALRVNFALGGALAGVQRLRRTLGVKSHAQVVTGEMGRAYEQLRGLPREAQPAALDAWLTSFGHRGPLESDPLQPRFDELRDALLLDLQAGGPPGPERVTKTGKGPLFWLERRREHFRHELMRSWRAMRAKMLEDGRVLVAAGSLEAVDDVFFLTAADLEPGAEGEFAQIASERRAAWTAGKRLALPSTARLDEVEAAGQDTGERAVAGSVVDAWDGIGLGGAPVVGRIRRADDLATLLRDGAANLGAEDVLLVPALEPAWAVLFGRVGAVVAELGGELSHASILLRELGTPAVVNCLGAWDALADGERVRVDPERGRVERVAPR